MLYIPETLLGLLYQDTKLNCDAISLFLHVKYLGPLSLTDLASQAGIGYRKVLSLCRQLTESGWLRRVSAGRKIRPVCWVPKAYQEHLIRQMEQDYALAPFAGEFLFGRILEFLVDVPRFVQNVRPDFLRHPVTKESLELDFFAPGVLGGEFNGLQHYAQTQKYSKKEVEEIQARDLVKAALCERHGLPLIVVKSENLSIRSVMALLPEEIPRHEVDLGEPYPTKLDRLCTLYRRKVPRLHQADSYP